MPSDPEDPPSNLKIRVLSVNESLLTSIVNGSFDLFPETVLLNVILPETCPVPEVTSDINVGSLNVVPPESFIIKSPVPMVPDKFCWFIIINISSSNAVFDDALGNANTCESEVIVNNLASSPCKPWVPCFDFASVIVFVKLTLADLAVKLTDPLSWLIPVIVNELLELVAVTPSELDPVNV